MTPCATAERAALGAHIPGGAAPLCYSPDEWGAYGFKGLVSQTKLEVPQVRRACRSLAKKGFAKFERTLWNEEDGQPAGAGYRATEEGAAYITPCDLCGKRATYDYYSG